MEAMLKVWYVTGAIWVTVLASIVYFGAIAAPIWLLLAGWFVPQAFIGTFMSFAICERKGWT